MTSISVISIKNTKENMDPLASGEIETFMNVSLPWSKTISVTCDKGRTFSASVLLNGSGEIPLIHLHKLLR
jgi:hypothetical protein